MIETKTKVKEYVFIDGQTISGISKKTEKPYEISKLIFADPATYENHKLDFKKGLNLSFLSKGERVTLETEFVPGFNGSDSRTIVTNVVPVK